MKKFMAIVLSLVLAVSAVSSASAVTYKLGHMSPLDNNYNLLAEHFKKLVEKESNGRIKIQIYPQAQLGYDRDLLEAMQFGNVDFAVNTASVVSNFAPLFGVLDLPYLFGGWDHIIKFVKSDAAVKLLSESQKTGLYGLGFMGRGFRSVTTNKNPIHKLADIKGMKLRVVESPVYVKTFEDFGAVASAMSFGEVFTALQQGAIDGEENPPETVFAERLYEVQKYMSFTQHIAGWAVLMAAKSTMDAMSAADQELIRKCAVEACTAETLTNREMENAYIKKLEGKGVKVNNVDDISEFSKVAKSAYAWFEKTYGKNGMAFVTAINALR